MVMIWDDLPDNAVPDEAQRVHVREWFEMAMEQRLPDSGVIIQVGPGDPGYDECVAAFERLVGTW